MVTRTVSTVHRPDQFTGEGTDPWSPGDTLRVGEIRVEPSGSRGVIWYLHPESPGGERPRPEGSTSPESCDL